MKKRAVTHKVPARANYTYDISKLLVIIMVAAVFSVMVSAEDKTDSQDDE